MSLAIETENKQEQFEINPYLSAEELANQQADLVAEIRSRGGEDEVYAVWVKPRGKYANVIRTLETNIFPEMPDVMDGYEDECEFLTLVDTRPGAERIVHAFRLSVPHEDKEEGLQIVLLDDLVKSDQGLTEEALVDYYAERGISLNTQAASVESNFFVGEKVEAPKGIRISDLGYIAIFKHVAEEGGAKVIFAHLNDNAVKSLGEINVQDEPIAGLTGLQTPTVSEDGVKSIDKKYHPVAIEGTEHNLGVFRDLSVFAAPAIIL